MQQESGCENDGSREKQKDWKSLVSTLEQLTDGLHGSSRKIASQAIHQLKDAFQGDGGNNAACISKVSRPARSLYLSRCDGDSSTMEADFCPPSIEQEMDVTRRFVIEKANLACDCQRCDHPMKKKSDVVLAAGVPWQVELQHGPTIHKQDPCYFRLSCLDTTAIACPDTPYPLLMRLVVQAGRNTGSTFKIDEVFGQDIWARVSDPMSGFISPDGQLLLEVRWAFIKTPVLSFDQPSVSTFCIVVEDKKIYVSPDLLAIHSKYFFDLFYGPDSQFESELELPNVKYDEFIELVRVISPQRKAVTKQNVRYLTELAQTFAMPLVRKWCLRLMNTGCCATAQELLDIFVPEVETFDWKVQWNAIMAKSRFSVVVEGVKVPVSREFLAMHSTFFHRLFFCDSFCERNKTEMVLPAVGYKEFVDFLQLVFALEFQLDMITLDNVHSMLEYADRFMVPMVSRYCASFLCRSNLSRFSNPDFYLILQLADRYRLYSLRHALIPAILRPPPRTNSDKEILKSISDETKSFCIQAEEKSVFHPTFFPFHMQCSF